MGKGVRGRPIYSASGPGGYPSPWRIRHLRRLCCRALVAQAKWMMSGERWEKCRIMERWEAWRRRREAQAARRQRASGTHCPRKSAPKSSRPLPRRTG